MALRHCTYAALRVCRQNPLQARCEQVLELPQMALNASKPQLCLLSYVASSWMTSTHAHAKLHQTSLMDDVFLLPGNLSAACVTYTSTRIAFGVIILIVYMTFTCHT